jgi:hypothetical protein
VCAYDVAGADVAEADVAEADVAKADVRAAGRALAAKSRLRVLQLTHTTPDSPIFTHSKILPVWADDPCPALLVTIEAVQIVEDLHLR